MSRARPAASSAPATSPDVSTSPALAELHEPLELRLSQADGERGGFVEQRTIVAVFTHVEEGPRALKRA